MSINIEAILYFALSVIKTYVFDFIDQIKNMSFSDVSYCTIAHMTTLYNTVPPPNYCDQDRVSVRGALPLSAANIMHAVYDSPCATCRAARLNSQGLV